jgi:hypothetical protein
MLETLKKKLANSRAYRWLTIYAYENGFSEGVGIGYKLSEKLVRQQSTNAERKRVLDILSKERARLLAIEERQWEGYCADTLQQIDLLMLAIGSKETS